MTTDTEAPEAAPLTDADRMALDFLAGVSRARFAQAQAAGSAAAALEVTPEAKADAYHRGYILAARKAGLAPVCHCSWCAATKAQAVSV